MKIKQNRLFSALSFGTYKESRKFPWPKPWAHFFTEASGVGQKEDWFVSTTAARQMELTSNELSICLTNTGMLGGQKASCGKAAICWASTAIFKAAHLARFSEHMRFAALSEAFKGKSKSFKFSATKKNDGFQIH